MFLKSLTLKGFKSFADRTHLRLEPGVSVMVGPNGSGKSNISDAVLWVLGEQSAKQLRGNVMEDVVFAGSSARQAVGVAEVDLVLDNADSALPLEFHEVTIRRRMFRSGESEYFLNNAPCRLMDVLDLLHDTGLGRDTHSIISQGGLDEVLNSKPEDRRALIEEAAGVLKYKKRKERALRKLGAMEGHLERARDIVGEIDRQLRPLERQAAKAEEHVRLTRELRELEVAIAVADLNALKDHWETLGKAEREREAEVELARYRLGGKERELEKSQSLLEEKGLFVGDLGEQRRKLQAVLERLHSGLLLLEEKGKNLVERLSDLRAKIHQSETRLRARHDEKQRLTEERSVSDAQLEALYARLGELRREAEGVKKERLAAEEELSRANSAMRKARKQIDDDKNDLVKLEQALGAFRLEQQLLSERADAVRAQEASLGATLSARRVRTRELEKAASHARKQSALAASDVDRRVRVLEARKRDAAQRAEELAGVRARVRALEELDRALEAASPALALALSKQRKLPGLIGPVTDLLSVPADREGLVEQALGPDLFCLITRDRACAHKLLRSFEKEGVGDASVLAVEDARPCPPVPGGTGERLADTVSCTEEVRPAIEALLGDVYVVETLDAALAAASVTDAKLRFATRDGRMVMSSGKVSAGPSADASSNVLARRRQINGLKDEVSAAAARVGECDAAVAEAEDALAAAQQDALELGQKLAAADGQRESLREELGRLEAALADLMAESQRIGRRLGEIETRCRKDAPGAGVLRERIAEAERGLEALEEQAARRREERDARFREEAAISNKLGSCQVDVAAVSEREVHLKRQLAAALADAAELETALRHSRETEEALEVLRERVQPLHDAYALMLEQAEHWAEKLYDRARFEQTDSESLRTAIREAQDAVKAAQGDIETLSEALNGVRIEKAQVQVQVDTAVERIVEEYATPLETALASEPVSEREAAVDELHRLRRQVANLGPVNPVAAEEHSSLKDRRDFLAAQMEDVATSRLTLQKVVRAIDRKMRERFLETFEQVDSHFQAVFAVLFPGGRACMRLTEADDPENTGIEVVAQPLGKKLSKMSLMSGGEKSLTALALLFALYRTRPCPFYILDEVDAALDDSNLRRFITLVDSMRRHTQFIVVTHQRRTMETADVLYGVSMQADGVSKTVSQKLDRTAWENADDTAVV